MATNIQRAQSIASALVNKTATAAQIDRIGVALTRIPFVTSVNYEGMTGAEKAGFIVSQLRELIISNIKQHDLAVAARAAPVADPAAVDAEFAETP